MFVGSQVQIAHGILVLLKSLAVMSMFILNMIVAMCFMKIPTEGKLS